MSQPIDQRVERVNRLGSGYAAIPLALGGMLGAGVFLGLAPAAAGAGTLLLLGLPISALTASCWALVSAHQSSAYRGPGPSYACTRSRLGVLPARVGASAHLAGQVAAMAAIAETVGTYLLPASASGVAAAAVLLVVLASTAGLRIRGVAAWMWLALTVAVFVAVAAVCFAIEPVGTTMTGQPLGDHAVGITGSAGVLYFAFLGLDRLTAPVQERDRFAWKSIRRGVIVSVVATTVLCALFAVALLHQLGPQRLALSPVPVIDALGAAAATELRPLVGVAIAVAMLPVLLGALESFRSTASAVVHDGDLPAALGRTGAHGTPYLLDVLTGVAAVVVVLAVGPVQAMTTAVCCVLVHQAFASAAGRVLLSDEHKWVMRSTCLGMGLSVVLAMSMPIAAMLTTAAVVVLGPLLAGVVSRRWS